MIWNTDRMDYFAADFSKEWALPCRTVGSP